MSKKRFWLHTASISLLTAPNLIYMGCNFDVLKEANAVALTLSALIILSIVGLGALAHFKTNAGIWVTLIGVLVLSMSNIAYIIGVALMIEGGGLAVDGYLFRPLIKKAKIEELKEDGETVSYTTQV